MITFSKLEQKGNLGNQLFQIAATVGIAKANNHLFGFKPWSYTAYFDYNLPQIEHQDTNFISVKEKKYSYHKWEGLLHTKNYDLEGWLQSERYFDIPLTKQLFKFKPTIVNTLKNKYKKAFAKPTILLSIRRGDFVNHKDYYQTPIMYFLNALHVHFTNWEHYNLIVLSDDIAYCKYHFGFLPNAYFGEGLNAIEQLCLGSLCNHFIISNSTFSWWSAWLGEKKDSKIIVPIKNFRNQKAQEFNDKDYFPERWIKFNYLTQKITIKANLYLESNPFQASVLQNYLNHFFKINSFSLKQEFDKASHKEHALIFSGKIISPIAIYYSYLQLVKGENCSFKYYNLIPINYKLSTSTFKNMQDFGVYTKVFKTTKLVGKKEVVLKAITVNSQATTNSFVLGNVGMFTKSLGYTYFSKVRLKKETNNIKSKVKKIMKYLKIK